MKRASIQLSILEKQLVDSIAREVQQTIMESNSLVETTSRDGTGKRQRLDDPERPMTTMPTAELEDLQTKLADARARLAELEREAQAVVQTDEKEQDKEREDETEAAARDRQLRLAAADARLRQLACPVCYTNSLEMTYLPCNHLFCAKCVCRFLTGPRLLWMCPLCRENASQLRVFKAASRCSDIPHLHSDGKRYYPPMSTTLLRELQLVSADGVNYAVVALAKALSDPQASLNEIKAHSELLSSRLALIFNTDQWGSCPDAPAMAELQAAYSAAGPLRQLAVMMREDDGSIIFPLPGYSVAPLLADIGIVVAPHFSDITVPAVLLARVVESRSDRELQQAAGLAEELLVTVSREHCGFTTPQAVTRPLNHARPLAEGQSDFSGELALLASVNAALRCPGYSTETRRAVGAVLAELTWRVGDAMYHHAAQVAGTRPLAGTSESHSESAQSSS
jgi:hypothetical protein